MKRFWISWCTAVADYPKTPWPWWVSGIVDLEPPLENICAVIDAPNEDTAKRMTLEAFPDAVKSTLLASRGRDEWRFCEERASDWAPGERFPPVSAE